MLVAVGAKLLQFNPRRGVTAVLGGCVSGNTRRSLGDVGATVGAFQRHNQARPLLTCHNAISTKFKRTKLNTNQYYFIRRVT